VLFSPGGRKTTADPPPADLLLFQAGDGDDALLLSSRTLTGAGSVVTCTTGDFRIEAGAGNDQIDVAGPISSLLAVTFDGGAGNDDLEFITPTSTTNGTQNFTIDADQVTWNYFTCTYVGTQSLTVTGGATSETVTLAEPLTLAFQLHGGTGADALNVNAGTYAFDADAGLTTSSLTVTVAAGAAVRFDASQHLAALHVDGGLAAVAPGGDKVIAVGDLTITGGGGFDLADDSLILSLGSATAWNGSAYDGVAGLIASGRNGAAAGGGGLWSGSGIVTSSAGSGNLTTIGFATAATLLGLGDGETALWQGQTVDASAVLVKYTYGGDANLDGKINIDDYGRIDSNVGRNGSVFGWYNGDFNYDGNINIDDYGIIDANIGVQGPPL
jgi:hypothetical protein